MSPHLLSLPSEMQIHMIGYLTEDANAIRHLSLTCRFYQSLLCQQVHRSITLHNDERRASSVRAIAAGSNRGHVRDIHFHGFVPDYYLPDVMDYWIEKPLDPIFPADARAVLSDLRLFPNLETLTITFEFRVQDVVTWSSTIFPFEEELSVVQEQEEREPFRGLMRETYRALGKNREQCVRNLKLLDVAPMKVSQFWDSRFHTFLNTIESFEISLWVDDDDLDATNGLNYYCPFIETLDTAFFNHLTSVTNFTLTARSRGPIGGTGMYHARLMLTAQQMPVLRSLHLDHGFICDELIAFLAGHASRLESVDLRHVSGDCDEVPVVTWTRLLNRFADANPHRLKRLGITPLDAPCWTPNPSSSDQEEPKTARLARERLASRPHAAHFQLCPCRREGKAFVINMRRKIASPSWLEKTSRRSTAVSA